MTNSFRAAKVGLSNSTGSFCASSRMMTLFASRWSLRQALGLEAKRDSNNCTFVVTMSGAFQVPALNGRARVPGGMQVRMVLDKGSRSIAGKSLPESVSRSR